VNRRDVGQARSGQAPQPEAAPQVAPSESKVVAPSAGAVIRGHVRTSARDPVEGVRTFALRRRSQAMQAVEFMAKAASISVAESLVMGLTDSDGAFALAVDPAAEYSVSAQAAGFSIPADWRDVKAGAIVDFEAVEYAALRRVAVDADAGAAERISAWETLCHTPGGFTPEVVDAALESARTSKDAHVRERAVNTLHVAFMMMRHGGDPPPKTFETTAPVALRGDADERVRMWAAVSLDLYLDDAVARDALGHASGSDASEKVRDAATNALAGAGR